MIFIAVFALGVLAFLIFYCSVLHRFQHFSKQKVLGPRPEFPFGNTKQTIFGNCNICYDVDDVYKKFKGKASFAGFFHLLTPYVLVLDPNIIKSCRKFRNNDFVIDERKDPIVGLNTFFLKDDVWKTKRREIDFTMTSSKVRSMFPLIVNGARNLSNYIKREINDNQSKAFEARDFTTRYTCDVIYSCLYGIDANSFESEKPLMHEYGKKYLKGIMESLVSLIPKQMMTSEIEKFFMNLTKDTINYRLHNNIIRDDMLGHSVMLQKSKGFSDVDILGHCMTLFLNSFETSAITVQNALYQLGRNPQVQEKLRAEINENINTDEDFTYEKINELPYLDQVFYETLRLHPGLTYTTRVCTEDVEVIGVDGEKQNIQKDSAIWIPIHSIHRDSEYYPEPEKFIPERFNQENGGIKAFTERCVLIPFGDGGRTCSGKKFATFEVKTALVEILKNFEVSIDEKTAENLKICPKEFMNISDKPMFMNFKEIL